MSGREPARSAECPAETGNVAAARRVGRAVFVSLLLAAIATPLIVWTAQARRRGDVPDPVTPGRSATERRAALPDLFPAVVEPPAIPFRDVTAEAGIAFAHDNGARGAKLLPEVYGSGCAFVDYNNDESPDILLINSMPSGGEESSEQESTLKLFRNDGAGRFSDATQQAGLAHSLVGMGAAAGDFDNDGWVDLYVTAVGRNRLFRNNRGAFEDVTEASGTGGPSEEWSTGCCWFDFDGDGDLDLFVGNYVKWNEEDDRRLDCRLLGVERSYCHPELFEGTFPRLYRNNGSSRFADVSESAGVQVRNADTEVPVAKSLSVVPTDVNGDGWIDLVVANDGVRNFLFLNRKNGTFSEVGEEWGLAYDNAGRSRRATGLDAGFFDNGERLGVVFGGVAHQPTRLYVLNPKLSFFTEDSLATGLGPRTLISFNFSLLLVDADLDGRIDVVATNGQTEPGYEKLRTSQSYAQPPQLIWNSGQETTHRFVTVPVERCGDLARPIVGRGSALADVDGDGDLDLLLTANGGSPRLLRNDVILDSASEGSHNWLRLKLVGTRSNRSAIGARVTLHSGARVQVREVNPARGYLSQSELTVTFGLGERTKADRIDVRWPDGLTTELKDVAGNRTMRIVQPEVP